MRHLTDLPSISSSLLLSLDLWLDFFRKVCIWGTLKPLHNVSNYDASLVTLCCIVYCYSYNYLAWILYHSASFMWVCVCAGQSCHTHLYKTNPFSSVLLFLPILHLICYKCLCTIKLNRVSDLTFELLI